MVVRLLVGGVLWLTAMVLFAAALQWSGRPRPALPSSPVSALARSLNHLQSGDSQQRWYVIKATSAHHVMVVDVETDEVGTARVIAGEIVDGAKHSAYDEILIYVRKIGEGRGSAGQRVQWTPAGGLVETTLQ
jgi:hypothetical protein